MKKLACVTAVLGALAAVGAGTPANAAVYCFDGAGRPVGTGFDSHTPNYQLIEIARRSGGYCRDLGPGRTLPHVEGNGHYYDGGGYQYRQPRYYRHSGDDGYRGEGRRQRKDYRHPSTSPKYHRAPDYTQPQGPVPQQPNQAR